MRATIAELLAVDEAAVNVKASSGNLSGDEGAGRSISAIAVAIAGACSMTVSLHDTLSGETRPLVPIGETVGIYSCGPTVYGPVHVGNFRSFLFADILVRHLRWRGYSVRWVMNVTDVDDKIIRGAAAAGIGIETLADRHLAGFLGEAAALRMTTPDVLPRATAHIDEMVAMIETLLERGHAYRTDDGSIFFRIASWPGYGQLARLDPDALRVGERVEADEYAKDDVRDFALWKGPKPGEPSWDTAIGPGRPGWHIECSAMSMAHLGPSFDIHTGGVDLIFPHHEDEIAQSEAATGKPFVGTWLHCAHLQMSGSKMAKSTGNIARVGELLAAGVSPRALRYALISVHYRASLNYTDDSLAAAGAAVERLDAALAALEAYREDRPDDPDAAGCPVGGDARRSARRLTTTSTSRRDWARSSTSCATSTGGSRRGRCRRRMPRPRPSALRDLDRVLGVLPDVDDGLDAESAALLEARARRPGST